jgi:hypothetical protein
LCLFPHSQKLLVANTDPDIACHHGGNNGTSAIGTTPSGSQVVFEWAYVRFCSAVMVSFELTHPFKI